MAEEHVECYTVKLFADDSSLFYAAANIADIAGIRHFYPQADTLRVHLTLTLWVQCIMHLRSTF